MIVIMLFQELENLMKLKTKEHKKFVDAIVIDFVPMQVCNVEEGLEPFLLAL